MTTPTTLATEAGSGYPAKFTPQNNIFQSVSYTVPATTASGTVIGMMKFQKGARIVSGFMQSADLDTGTNVTINCGYQYVTGSSGTDNDDAFVAASTLPQAGGIISFPAASGATTSTELTTAGAADDGYIVIKTGGGSTTTAGTVTVGITFSYGG